MNVIRKASLSRSNQIKKRRMVAYALVWLLGVLVLTEVFRFSADHEPRSNSTDKRELASTSVMTVHAASNRLSSVGPSVDSDKLEAVDPPSEHPFYNPIFSFAESPAV